jgi:dCTP deaminase
MMGVMPDSWIREMSLNHDMIKPFAEEGGKRGVISYGLSSYGYDMRLSEDFLIFQPEGISVIDPKDLPEDALESFHGTECLIPPGGFVLGKSFEYFKIPRDILTLCVGKSTYARCGISVNVTPFEPEWEGYPTLQIANHTPSPAKIYANEGIAQVVFLRAEKICDISYVDKKGRYQAQKDITPPRM